VTRLIVVYILRGIAPHEVEEDRREDAVAERVIPPDFPYLVTSFTRSCTVSCIIAFPDTCPREFFLPRPNRLNCSK
jgi:hypothetical protein